MPGGSPPGAPFLRLEGRGGHSITGEGDALVYQKGRRAVPVTLELARIETVRLDRRSGMFLLPIAVMNLLWLYPMGTPWFVGGLCMLSLLLPIYALRNCGLVVHTREGKKLRWYLDTLWPDTRRWRALDEAWAVAARALASRGISVQDAKR